MNKGNHWTAEHCTQQSRAIHRWKPWLRSTGPRTAEGKAASSRNAWKGGTRLVLRALAGALRKQREWTGD